MTDLIRDLHVIGRWVVTIMTVVAFLRLLWGMKQNKPVDQQTQKLVTIWGISVDTQWALGILLFVVLGDFELRYRWLHAIVMTLAVVVAHTSAMLKKREDKLRYQAGLVSMIVVMVLVFIGVDVLTW
jgi:hypothetical protein